MRKLLFFVPLFFAATLPSQELRRGLLGADALLVGRQVSKTAHGEALMLHRVQVLRPLRGLDGATAVTVIDWPGLSLHNRPQVRQSRLYCLLDASGLAQKEGLPAAGAPYFRMGGWAGSNPLIGADLDADAIVALAQTLVRSEAGAAPQITASELFAQALSNDARTRTEAAQLLSERPVLRSQLHALQWSQLAAAAVGETQDVPHKIALAELCAEQRLDGLLDGLMASLGPVEDLTYARAVGRIAQVLHGESAAHRLNQRLRAVTSANDRRCLLVAMANTKSEAALAQLQALRRQVPMDPDVAAALREHGADQ